MKALIAPVLWIGLTAAGCYVQTEPVGYAETTSVPADLTVYPTTTYQNRTVYYVDDRWVYRDRDRWQYYRTEPAPLYRYRSTVRAAPPAPAYVPPPAAPPPAVPRSAPPHTAPPAGRVR